MAGRRLYERAAPAQTGSRPLWYVGEGVSVFAGPLQKNAPHSHSVPVLLAGLYGKFRLRVGHENWLACRTAVVPPGVAYEFDMAGDALGVIYLEPSVAGVTALIPLVSENYECGGALIGEGGDTHAIRQLFEDQQSTHWAEEALRDLVSFADRRARRQADPRIAKVIRQLQQRAGEQTSAADAGAFIGLSASRFQHVFAAEIGVPFRRYRAWQRMLAAIRAIGAGANFTQAAHAVGYSDQPHFAHDFRRMFGASASPSMINVRG